MKFCSLINLQKLDKAWIVEPINAINLLTWSFFLPYFIVIRKFFAFWLTLLCLNFTWWCIGSGPWSYLNIVSLLLLLDLLFVVFITWYFSSSQLYWFLIFWYIYIYIVIHIYCSSYVRVPLFFLMNYNHGQNILEKF